MSNDHQPKTEYFVDSAGLCYATKPSDGGIRHTYKFNFLMIKNSAREYEIEIVPDYSDKDSLSDGELDHLLESGDWEKINFPFNLKPQFEYLGPEGKQK